MLITVVIGSMDVHVTSMSRLSGTYCFSISDTTLFTITATDSDGPQLLHFSIPANHETNQIVFLANVRGDNTARMVDVKLKTQLDRDFTVSCVVWD